MVRATPILAIVVLALLCATPADASNLAEKLERKKGKSSALANGHIPRINKPSQVAVDADNVQEGALTTREGKQTFRDLLETELPPVKKEKPLPHENTATTALWNKMLATLETVCEGQDVGAINKAILGKLHVSAESPYFKDHMAALEKDVDPADVVRRAGHCNKANDYLYYAFKKLSAKPAFVAEAAELFKSSRKQMCYAVVFAGVLDRLGELSAQDFRIMNHFSETSAKIRNDNKWSYLKRFYWNKGTFGVVKHFSVEKPFSSFFVPVLEKVADKKLAYEEQPFGASFGTTINIAEATIQDKVDGFPLNAAAGARLVESALLPFPSHIAHSEGHKGQYALEFFFDWLPSAKKWSDLYQIWNMAFVIRFDDWTIMFSKLLNPYVSCYNAPHNPARYIYRRAVSLMMLIVSVVDELVYDKGPNNSPKWSNEFRSAFGAANAQSAARFRQSLLQTPSFKAKSITDGDASDALRPAGYGWKSFLWMFDQFQAQEGAVAITARDPTPRTPTAREQKDEFFTPREPTAEQQAAAKKGK